MEPISIAASFIALGQAVGMVPKFVKILRSTTHLGDELASLLNEVSSYLTRFVMKLFEEANY